jgi:hypothetical protein
LKLKIISTFINLIWIMFPVFWARTIPGRDSPAQSGPVSGALPEGFPAPAGPDFGKTAWQAGFALPVKRKSLIFMDIKIFL